MPGGLEFYAGAELFSKKQFDVSFRTKLFCFIFIMGEKTPTICTSVHNDAACCLQQ